MKQYLLVTAEDVFVKARDKQRRAGFINDHFDQFYKDVKVDGGGYNFHYKGGKMYYAHGHYVKLRNFDVVPAITPQKARDVFAAYKKIPVSAVTDFASELLIKEIAPMDSSANDEIGYVLAKTGQVVFTESILMHASSGTKIKTPKANIQPTKVLNPQAATGP